MSARKLAVLHVTHDPDANWYSVATVRKDGGYVCAGTELASLMAEWAEALTQDIEPDPCPNPCDHCRPDDWHGCVRTPGHKGHHSCEED